MVTMLRANEAPARDNILAVLFSWLALAGYVVSPDSFQFRSKLNSLDESKRGGNRQETRFNMRHSCLIIRFLLSFLVTALGK